MYNNYTSLYECDVAYYYYSIYYSMWVAHLTFVNLPFHKFDLLTELFHLHLPMPFCIPAAQNESQAIVFFNAKVLHT